MNKSGFSGANGLSSGSNIENNEWLNYYCKPCWEKEIFSLPFVESKINSQKEEIKSLEQQMNQLLAKTSDLTAQIASKDEELMKLKEQNDQIKNQLALNEQLLKTKDNEIGELDKETREIPNDSSTLDSFRKILLEFETKHSCMRKSSELDPEMIRQTLTKEIEQIIGPVLRERLKPVSELFDKLTIQCEGNLQQLEKLKQDDVQVKPVQKTPENKKSLMEKWRDLKSKLMAL